MYSAKRQKLTREEMLLSAIETNQAAKVQELIDLAVDVNYQDNDGLTPLMLAASLGRTNFVHSLLGNGAKINEITKSGNTALMLAAKEGKLQVVQLLLKQGANKSMQNYAKKSVDRKTAHQLAIQENHLATASAIANFVPAATAAPVTFASSRRSPITDNSGQPAVTRTESPVTDVINFDWSTAPTEAISLTMENKSEESVVLPALDLNDDDGYQSQFRFF